MMKMNKLRFKNRRRVSYQKGIYKNLIRVIIIRVIIHKNKTYFPNTI